MLEDGARLEKSQTQTSQVLQTSPLSFQKALVGTVRAVTEETVEGTLGQRRPSLGSAEVGGQRRWLQGENQMWKWLWWQVKALHVVHEAEQPSPGPHPLAGGILSFNGYSMSAAGGSGIWCAILSGGEQQALCFLCFPTTL